MMMVTMMMLTMMKYSTVVRCHCSVDCNVVFVCYQKKDVEDKKLKNGDAKVGSGRIIPLKQVQENCFW